MTKEAYTKLTSSKSIRFFMTIRVLISSAIGLAIGAVIYAVAAVFSNGNAAIGEYCLTAAGYCAAFPGVFGGLIHLMKHS